MPTYTRAQFKTRVNAGIKSKIGMLVSSEDLLNQAVRDVLDEVDLRSTKRRAALAPNLFSEVYQYAAPTDLKGQKVIDIAPQINRNKFSSFHLVAPEEFDRRKDDRSVSVDDRDSVKKLLVSRSVNDETLVISTLDSTTAGGGTWTAVGDAEDIEANSDNFVKGAQSIEFDIGSGATTTAGIVNTSLTAFDITDYRNHSAFVWAYITSTTNLTNFILNIGNDSSNYLSKTVTTTNEGTAFVIGWNLLRFDLTSATETGTVSLDSCDYVKLYMTKTVGKINETGYRFDHIMLKKGEIYNVSYYSKYGWQSSSGTYKENSTDDADLLNCDTDEFNLFIQKGIELAAAEVDENEIEKSARTRYTEKRDIYLDNNPSEAMLLGSTYYEFI